MVQHSVCALQSAGYGPYYLYRQKGTLQNLENTGWGKAGLCGALQHLYHGRGAYHSISGRGRLYQAGGPAGRIERVFNHKYPLEYLARFDEVLARKQKIEDFYGKWFDMDTQTAG